MYYQVLHINNKSKESIEAEVRLNSNHEVFKGHFPGQPVLPGACMVQMLRAILEQAMQCEFKLSKASNIKFLSVVVPNIHTTIKYTIDIKSVSEDKLAVESQLWAGEVSSMKFSGLYKMER